MNFFSKCKNLEIKNTRKESIPTRIAQFMLGCFIIALSYNIFISPNNLVPGGVGGIAVIVNNLFGFDNSTVILVINLLLLILSYIMIGKEKTRHTILGTILLPILIKLTENFNVWVQIDTSKVFLMTLIGGISYGFGAGLVFKAGFTTGGTDIINQIISKYANISMGKSMLLSDGLIVLSSGIFFGIDSLLYSIVILYLISLIADRVILGISSNKMYYIITEKDEETRLFILQELHHGVTILNAKGGYGKQNKKMLLTVLPTSDYYNLKKGLNRIDKKACLIVTDSYELVGGE